jgi:four helix bundle protein
MKISLEELRECLVSLRITKRLKLSHEELNLDSVTDEADQLVAIFVKSIETVQRNKVKK